MSDFDDSNDGSRNEHFLARWSKRKHQVTVSHDPPQAGQQTEPNNPCPAASLEPEPLTDADMPTLDSLREDSDYTGFLSPGVSDRLKKLALRKLFHLPGFNFRDGLDDYDEDFGIFEPLGDIVTSDMKHQIEMRAKREKERLAAELESHEQDEQNGRLTQVSQSDASTEDRQPGEPETEIDTCITQSNGNRSANPAAAEFSQVKDPKGAK